jgi:ABC-2 type transport system permease protein
LKLSHLGITTLMELKKIIHDRRRLAVLVLGPVFLCLIFGYSAYYDPQNVTLAVYVDHFFSQSLPENAQTRQIIDDIDHTRTFNVDEVYSMEEAVQRLDRGLVRGIVVFQEGPSGLQKIEVTVDVTDRIVQQAITSDLPPILAAGSGQKSVQAMSAVGIGQDQTPRIITPFTVNFSDNKNRTLTQFDMGASGVMILFVVGISLIMASIAITSERSKGTIERIFASPLNRWVIILSKVLAYSLFAILIAFVIWLTLKLAFDITVGNVALILLFIVLASINAIIMGLLVSSVTYTELESVLGATIIWFLSMFLMGLTFPLESMHPMFTYFAKLIPFTYALNSVRNVNLIGWGFSETLPDLFILLGFLAVFTVAATILLRREIR